uniref:Large ribosomal subunit protein uL4c n=1 Tax=Synura sphagnicola TaxID=52556 RepID=A0A3G2QYU5_9STRA|nr:ribosomal protein L4 [Synura sphagnicola]
METNLFLQNSEEKKQAIGLIHRVYLSQLKNSRKFLAHTKTKSEVRGGGKKPWRQKGTGRARAGSIRSPLWVGGGVIFGPKPRIVFKKINKKEKQLAIVSALFLKEKDFILVNENQFKLETVKTKQINEWLTSLKLNPKSRILFILKNSNRFFWLSSRNLKNIQVTTILSMNIEQLLKAEKIIISNESLDLIKSKYGKNEF